jgi:hypothetical protein
MLAYKKKTNSEKRAAQDFSILYYKPVVKKRMFAFRVYSYSITINVFKKCKLIILHLLMLMFILGIVIQAERDFNIFWFLCLVWR